ncbi:MAG TPA: hypothetical protein VF770_07810 [Solirubrobacterales bacterium]
MEPRGISLGRNLWGLGASLVTLLVGASLIVAPFALGYQPYGADWVSQTSNDFWVGLAVVVVSLAGLGLFVGSLLGDLRAAGVIKPEPEPTPAGARSPSLAPSDDDPERAITALAAALAASLAERRQNDHHDEAYTSPNAPAGAGR